MKKIQNKITKEIFTRTDDNGKEVEIELADSVEIVERKDEPGRGNLITDGLELRGIDLNKIELIKK